RRIVPGADAVKMPDIELSLRPVETEDSGAANQAVEVRTIQGEIDTKRLVSHSASFLIAERESADEFSGDHRDSYLPPIRKVCPKRVRDVGQALPAAIEHVKQGRRASAHRGEPLVSGWPRQ